MFKNVVVLICDGAYLPAALFVAAQIEAQPVRTYDLVLIRTDIDTPVPTVDRSGKVVIGARSRIARAFACEGTTPATLARLLLSELLPQHYSRILYLDCDIWIGTHELHRLFDVDFAGYPVAAARDGFELFSRHENCFQQHKLDIGMSPGALYFNAGVMLIDRERWDAERIGEKALAFVSRGKHLEHQDQTALNAAVDGRWHELSPRWNWFHATHQRLTREFAPHIVHFVGPSKPWNDKRARYPSRFAAEMQNFYARANFGEFFHATPRAARLRRYLFTGLKDLRALVYDRREREIRKLMRLHAVAAPTERLRDFEPHAEPQKASVSVPA